MTMRDKIERVLKQAGHAYAGSNPQETAAEWIDYGFAASEVKEWIAVECWEPQVADECRKAGLTPDEAAEVIGASMYAVCNGERSVRDFVDA